MAYCSSSRDEPLGASEVCELIAISRGSLTHRRRHGFPSPIANLAATPVWSRRQIETYARERVADFHERRGVEAVALSSIVGVDRAPVDSLVGATLLGTAEVAELLGLSPAAVCDRARTHPEFPKPVARSTWSPKPLRRPGP